MLNGTSIERATLLRELFQAGVDAVGGFEATARALQDIELGANVHLVALGKASDSMARGALHILGDKIVSGLVVTKHGHLSDELKSYDLFDCYESGHPVPDEASLIAGDKLVEYVRRIPSSDTLLFMVSGGTSALVEHLNAGLTLDDLKRETGKLLASGAAIGEMNKHRRTLSRIKGGKLASTIQCQVVQLLISDVPGDRLADIGSGLLVPDALTGMPPELPVWQRVSTRIIASSAIAQAAVKTAALHRGLFVVQGSGDLDGDMPEVLDRISNVIGSVQSQPGVYIWGGEPTVVLPENPGRGGRNQHLALALCESVAARGNASILVCGTDGTDGPTNDAGGLVSDATLASALENNLQINDYLARADAGNCLDALNALVTTGPTGTNVMDLAIAIID